MLNKVEINSQVESMNKAESMNKVELMSRVELMSKAETWNRVDLVRPVETDLPFRMVLIRKALKTVEAKPKLEMEYLRVLSEANLIDNTCYSIFFNLLILIFSCKDIKMKLPLQVIIKNLR